MRRLVQLIPAYHEHDAIGRHIRTIEDYYQSLDWDCTVAALEIDPDLQNRASRFHGLDISGDHDTYWVYHYALPSELTQAFLQATGKKILVYHNLTPSSYFLPWNPSLAFLTDAGRKELETLKDHVDWTLADSDYNAAEMRDMGFDPVDVMPILVDWDRYPEPSPITRDQYFDPFYETWLFVGRIVPNKRIEDLIKTFFWYRKMNHNATRLLMAGKLDNTPLYVRWLMEIREAFHLEPQDCSFLGPVSDRDLATLYSYSDLLITLSDHEGFCLPLVEAMHYSTPVLAYAASAIPETVGDAGAVVCSRDPVILSEFIRDYIVKTQNTSAWRDRQRKRLNQLDPLPYLIRFREKLENLT